MLNPTEEHVNGQIEGLSELADLLLKKSVSSDDLLVIPFVGAGASASAGIPASGELQKLLFQSSNFRLSFCINHL